MRNLNEDHFQPTIELDALRRFVRLRRRSLGLESVGVDELAQELAVQLTSAAQRFDPAKGSWSAFSDRVALNRLREMARRRRKAPDIAELSTDVADRRGSARLEASALRFDVARAVRRLPPAMRRFAEALQTGSVTEAAAVAGLSRSSAYELVHAIRHRFEAEGLSVYADHRKDD